MKNEIDLRKPEESIKAYLEAGGDPNQEDRWGRSLLHRVAEISSEAVQLLLDAGAKVDSRDHARYTPLHYASKPSIVKLLIAAGAKVNARSSRGQTPLHSVSVIKAETVSILLEAGANIHAKSHDGKTALHYAAEHYHRTIPVLLEAGADPTIRDKKGRLPEDMVGNYLERMRQCRSDPHNYDLTWKLVTAREARELAAVANEGKSEGRVGRRRI